MCSTKYGKLVKQILLVKFSAKFHCLYNEPELPVLLYLSI